MGVRVCLVAAFIAGASTGAAAAPHTSSSTIPLRFERNEGQTDSRVRFVSRDPRFTLFLTDEALVMSLEGGHGRASSVRIAFDGARRSPRIEGIGQGGGATNYFHGHDPAAWQTSIGGFTSVRYTGLYPDVDLVVYRREREVEYDFVVAPGADPSVIRLRIAGGATTIDESGAVRITTPSASVALSRPVVYQDLPNGRGMIDGRYVRLSNGEIGLRLGRYDRSRPLVIDPVLAYSTYLGGSDIDWASDLRVDAAGNAYVCGFTQSLNFPATVGQVASGGSYDAFVAKVAPDGTLAWATYLGGSGFDTCDHLALDHDGFIYAGGFTGSPNFPVVGGFQSTLNGSGNAYVTKLDPSGSRIVYSTYFGGSGSDEVEAITVDASGTAYVAGTTTSTDFPVVNAVQPLYAGGFFDAFVAKITPSGDALQFSTYTGGSSDDTGTSIAVGPDGAIWVGGVTPSTDFPVVNPLQAQNHGSLDGYILKLSPDGSTILYSTYLGTTGSFDAVTSLRAMDDGTVLVSGLAGFGLPVTPGVFGAFFHNGFSDAYAGRLSADGQHFLFLTYLGGSGLDAATRIDVDPAGHVWIAGHTDSTNLPLRNPVQDSNRDGGCCQEVFVAEFSADATQLLFSTYLGGSDVDSNAGLGIDGLGNVYVAGVTSSADFPTVNPISQTLSGPRDAFLARIDVNHPPVADAGPDFSVNADASCHAVVTLDGSRSSDPDGDRLMYSWRGAFGTLSGVKPSFSATVGIQTATLVVSDGDGGVASDSVQITVNNAVPPSIDQLTATPVELDPPDHRMVDVNVTASVTPACGTTATCQIVSVTSNESTNGTGDGNTSTDWVITGPLTAQLRAERSGSGSGRVYTLTVRCTDTSGTSSTRTITVTVS